MPKDQSIGGYRIIDKLGEGGMAEVFLAVRPGSHEARTFAVKRILRSFRGHADLRELFAEELKLISQLDHPNIVRSVDSGECEDGRIYLVMEYVRGADLQQVLRAYRGERMPLEVAVQIATQAAAALDYVHASELAVIHRDVSPSNILLGEHGDVKLADFGIARFRGREAETSVWQLKGKLGYMSPEQFERPDYDHRSDLFSLGTVLYEMLTGVAAFRSHERHTISQTIHRVMHHTPVPVHVLRPEAPLALSEIVEAMLQKDPVERIGSAAEVREVLLKLSLQHDPRMVRHCVLRARAFLAMQRESQRHTPLQSALRIEPPRHDVQPATPLGTREVSLVDLQPLPEPHAEEASAFEEPLDTVSALPREAETGVTVLYRGPKTPLPRSTSPDGALSAALLRPRDSAEAYLLARDTRTGAPARRRARHHRGYRGPETAMLDEILSSPIPPYLQARESAVGPSRPARAIPRKEPRTLSSSARWLYSIALSAAVVVGAGLNEVHSALSHGRARSADRTGDINDAAPRPAAVQEAPEPTPQPPAEPAVAPLFEVANSLDLLAMPDAIAIPSAPPSARTQSSARAERRLGPRTAKLRVVLLPWGHVWIDGRPAGEAPAELSVAPGKHRIDVGQGTPSLTENVLLREGDNELSFEL